MKVLLAIAYDCSNNAFLDLHHESVPHDQRKTPMRIISQLGLFCDNCFFTLLSVSKEFRPEHALNDVEDGSTYVTLGEPFIRNTV